MTTPAITSSNPARAELGSALAATIGRVHAKGWAQGTGGNFSAVASREPLRLLMAPSGVDKGRVAVADLIEVDATGKVTGGTGRASAETALHLAIVKATGAGAVLHTHSITTTVLSLRPGTGRELIFTGYEMLKGLAGVTHHEHRERIPVLPNTQDMNACALEVKSLLAVLPTPHAVVLAGHGLYTWGVDLAEAERHVEILEFLFEVQYRRLLLGDLPAAPGPD